MLHTFYKGYANSAINVPLKDEDARWVERELESGEFSPVHKFSSNIESFNPGERADISVITDNSVDDDGEVFDVKTLNFDRFRKNPIVTFGHNYEIAPVGKSLWQKLIGDSIWKAKTQYVSRPEGFPKESEWLPDTIYHMVKEGYLPGKSIGGIGKKRRITEEDIQKNPSWKGARTLIENATVFEYSIVPMQANRNAIVEAVAKGTICLPDDILRKEFPEAFQQRVELPVIKNFRTLEDFQKEQQQKLQVGIEELYGKAPEIIDGMFSKSLGRV